MDPFDHFLSCDQENYAGHYDDDDDSFEYPPTPAPPRPSSKLKQFGADSAKNSDLDSETPSSYYTKNSVTDISRMTRSLFLNDMEEAKTGVSEKMRGILVDWLVEVGEQFELSSDTLFLTVSYIDRFLSTHQAILRNQLQLLAISCLLIASKHEEDDTRPTIKDLCYITKNSYTPDEVICMETVILVEFKFEISRPTAYTFLRKFVTAPEGNLQQFWELDSMAHLEFMASYLLELSLLDNRCEHFSPSVAAASALFLSRFIIDPKTHPWNSTLQCHTGVKPYDLKDCVIAMRELQMEDAKGSNSLRAVRQKYMKKFEPAIFQTVEIPASYFDPIEYFSQTNDDNGLNRFEFEG